MQSTVSDREALIATLRDKYKNEWGDESLKQAADMLEADAQEIARLNVIYEKAVQGRADFRDALRAQQVAVPPGYALVPTEPAREMVQDARDNKQ